MKLQIITDEEKHINIKLPTMLILNRFSVNYICRKLKKYKIYLDKRNLIKILKLCRKYKKKNPSFVLLEVDSRNNEHIEITI